MRTRLYSCGADIKPQHVSRSDAFYRTIRPLVYELQDYWMGKLMDVSLPGRTDQQVTCVQAILGRIAMDSPQAKEFLGQAGLKSSNFFCSHCHAPLAELSLFKDDYKSRTAEEAAIGGGQWHLCANKNQRTEALKETGWRYSDLPRALPYFDVESIYPFDIMHQLLLGKKPQFPIRV